MSFYDAKYPNLELIEYKFKQMLFDDEEWKKKAKKLRDTNKYLYPDFDVIVFSQIWGSTCTAFDVCEDGSAAMGGQAMTKAYTVVIKETITETYGVFINDKPCYKVTDAKDEFYSDLAERNMKSLSLARKFY